MKVRRPTLREVCLVAVGAAAGAICARSGTLVDWVRDSADWSTVPATVVGTSIPAAAGFAFARTLAGNSVRSLKRIELEEIRRDETHERARAIDEAEERANCWQRVMRAAEQVHPPMHTAIPMPIASRVTEIARQWHSAAVDEWREQGQGGPKPKPSPAAELAMVLIETPDRVRAHGPELVRCLTELVDRFGVHSMHVPLRATKALVGMAQNSSLWPDSDPARFFDAVMTDLTEFNARWAAAEETSRYSMTAIRQLSALANEYRARPHAADDVDPSIEWSDYFNRAPSLVEVPRSFAKLEDLIAAVR
jgi:hypothetical protein